MLCFIFWSIYCDSEDKMENISNYTVSSFLKVVLKGIWFLLSNCINEPRHEISNNGVCATSKGSDQPAHTRSLIRASASRLNIL